MLNNTAPQKWQRLQQKHLDQQFVVKVCEGCRCSPFEAQAILETVNEVYGSFFDNSTTIQPGQIQLTIVGAQARPSRSLSESPMVTVTLTLHDDAEDLPIRQNGGIVALRQHKLQRVCREAAQQGGLLTVEDLAHRLFNCGERTVCRDIRDLKNRGIVLPLRSTVQDMGRSLSHRADIVRHWLLGKEYAQIGRETHHSVEAVRNYVDKFKRVVALAPQNFDAPTIAFLVRISPDLVGQYLELYQKLDTVPHRRAEIQALLEKPSATQPQKNLKANPTGSRTQTPVQTHKLPC